MNRKEQDYINRLKKRLNHLNKRVMESPKELSYDKAEANALRWAISILVSLDFEDLDSNERIW